MFRIGDKEQVEGFRRAAEGGTAFEPNAFFERLIVMRETNPRAFDSLSQAARSSLAYYEAAKRKAEMMKDD